MAVRVYNSAWKVVKADELAQGSRSIESLDAIQAEIDAHNSTVTDDQWFLTTGEPVPIDQAPLIDIYIVSTTTRDIVQQSLDNPRIQYEENIAGWRYETAYRGGILYIDNIPPPPPVVIDTRTDYEKYALYVVDDDLDGAPDVESVADIVFEDHCEDRLPGQTIEQYYEIRRNAFINEVQTHTVEGWRLVEGKIYPTVKE